MATQSLVTTVSGGYNGGATITVLLDSNSVFTTTATDTYNLNYPVTSGSFNSILGNVDLTVTPPSTNRSPLLISFSGNYTETLTVNYNGQNTSYGYNYTHTATLETVDPEPEPEPPTPTGDMDIIFYVNNSEKQKINKSLSNETVFSGTLRGESSIINPSFMINMNNPSLFNYVYISAFNRYYFITDITSVRNGLWRVDCSVDVLMSFRTQILNLDVIISDATNENTNLYFSGDVWATTVKTKTDVLNFPNGLLDDGEYILITSGGVVS